MQAQIKPSIGRFSFAVWMVSIIALTLFTPAILNFFLNIVVGTSADLAGPRIVLRGLFLPFAAFFLCVLALIVTNRRLRDLKFPAILLLIFPVYPFFALGLRGAHFLSYLSPSVHLPIYYDVNIWVSLAFLLLFLILPRAVSQPSVKASLGSRLRECFLCESPIELAAFRKIFLVSFFVYTFFIFARHLLLQLAKADQSTPVTESIFFISSLTLGAIQLILFVLPLIRPTIRRLKDLNYPSWLILLFPISFPWAFSMIKIFVISAQNLFFQGHTKFDLAVSWLSFSASIGSLLLIGILLFAKKKIRDKSDESPLS